MNTPNADTEHRVRHAPLASARHIVLSGHVQGVGFRPFVYRIAHRHQISGWVQNQLGQVAIFAQGEAAHVDAFVDDLLERAPPLSQPHIVSMQATPPQDCADFLIVASRKTSDAQIFVPPDYFTCDACLRELTTPGDRRYRYPFINCTQCGPRYTLIERMPYDRPNTTMASFELCAECQREYDDPLNRRFHAEPVACPRCGPQLSFQSGHGEPAEADSVLAVRSADSAGRGALDSAIALLRVGKIVAVKGIGGYHLMCDAGSDAAVCRLRSRKRRPDKPLAVMFAARGSDGLQALRREVSVDSASAALLCSPMRPIVLLPKRANGHLSALLAPGLGELGVFLPYSPLHHLLLERFGDALVATSANLSGEPVLTGADEATSKLAEIADGFLHHDRPIARPADDPVFRSLTGHPRPLRLGRGCTPVERQLSVELEQPVLAVGGQLKNTIALGWNDRVIISPHIGDMDTPRSLRIFEQVVADLQRLYDVQAKTIICDAHPGYSTHRWAQRSALPATAVLHHFAHASALVGEHEIDGACLVFTWDGAGFGADGTLWGGETLLGTAGQWQRVVSMRPFFLPGGEQAGREPWRSAAALCWEHGVRWDRGSDTGFIYQAWQRRINCPQSSAVGRLFDAAAAIVMGIETTSYEGQAPMMLEALCHGDGAGDGDAIPMPLQPDKDNLLRVQWQEVLAHLCDREIPAARRAGNFHRSLAQTILEQSRLFRTSHGVAAVGLCGGVFQNRVLSDQVAALLDQDGFRVLQSNALPCNDAGLCFGQVVEYAASQATGASGNG